MSIDNCINIIINAYKIDYDPNELNEAKRDLKKIIKHRANQDIDYRTVRGRDILRRLKEGLQNAV